MYPSLETYHPVYQFASVEHDGLFQSEGYEQALLSELTKSELIVLCSPLREANRKAS